MGGFVKNYFYKSFKKKDLKILNELYGKNYIVFKKGKLLFFATFVWLTKVQSTIPGHHFEIAIFFQSPAVATVWVGMSKQVFSSVHIFLGFVQSGNTSIWIFFQFHLQIFFYRDR